MITCCGKGYWNFTAGGEHTEIILSHESIWLGCVASNTVLGGRAMVTALSSNV